MAFNKMIVFAVLLAVCYVTAAPAEAPKEDLKASESIGYGYAVAPAFYGGFYPNYRSSLYSYGYPSYYGGLHGYGYGQGLGYGYGYGGYPHGYLW